MRGRIGAARARALLPAACAFLFQGGFAVAVMALDRSNRALPSNLGYVVVVELAAAAVFLAAIAIRLARSRRALSVAIASPLETETPAARSAAEEPWMELVEAAKARSRAVLAERDARARAELDDFLESVHALKTPAAALSLMAERAARLGEGIPAPEARLEIDELDLILDRAMARLRLVDFERGSRLRRFDAGELARAVVRRHRRLFIARGISVGIEGGFEAESDPDWLGFALGELVSNAAKHAASRVEIRLAMAEGAGPGRSGLASIEVADDGPGFSPEDAARAFERSAAGGRLGASAGEAAPSSSGYGLYLARAAAERLGAILELAPGEGARLRLALAVSPGPLGYLSRM